MTKGNGTYRLRKYTWRSLLTFFGPLMLVGYYTWICCTFFIVPPSHGLVRTAYVSARWVYYSWFLLSVLGLDWAKAGLANIEAAALMYARLAPRTASQLMWHTDGKWANPLWWLRFIRTASRPMVAHCLPQHYRQYEKARPNRLWMFLSWTSLLITTALPLSGLTMEISNVRVYSSNQVRILGPNETTFNQRSPLELPERAYRNWVTGRQTTPTYGMLYAPKGTYNVSATYFDDEAKNLAPKIEVFAAPAVVELATGRVWGLSANISCKIVESDQFQMMKIYNPIRDDLHFGINLCRSIDGGGCVINDTWDSHDPYIGGGPFPLWFNDTGVSYTSMEFSHVVVADGRWSGAGGPYIQQNNHDSATYDSVLFGKPRDEPTTAIFEFFIWEHPDYTVNGSNRYTDYQTRNTSIHCDVASAVGYAHLDPLSRTYSSFEYGSSIDNTYDSTRNVRISDVVSPQIIAAAALANGNNMVDGSSAHFVKEPDGQVWKNLHNALNIALTPPSKEGGIQALLYNGIYPMLTGNQVLHAVYKLLGESVIALMDDGGVSEWEGELYRLESASYLVRGAIPWVAILVILSCWAFLVSGSALWLLTSARLRWAPSLDGFEMFRFGAEYSDTIHEFKTTGFQGCGDALGKIPGMIGVLPGGGIATHKMGFIGLSESEVGTNLEYTLDRRQAALSRII